jgi:hypothetical protein
MRNREQTKVVKIALTVSPESASILDGQSRICNWLYNNLLEQANIMRNNFRKSQDPEISKVLYTERGLRNLVPDLKKEKPFLRVVHSSPIKNAALRLSNSIQTYQKSRKGKCKGKDTGWPSFRSWSRNWFSLLYDEPNKGYRLDGNMLRINQQSIEIAAPLWLKNIDLRLDEIIAKRDKCKRKSQKVYLTENINEKSHFYWKPSKKWKKLDNIVENLRRKRREQTKTFLFTIAQNLFKQYDLVAIGDYTPDGTGKQNKCAVQ